MFSWGNSNKIKEFDFDYEIITTYFDDRLYLDICESEHGLVAIAYSHDNREDVFTDAIQSKDVGRYKDRYVGHSFMKKSGQFLGNSKVTSKYLRIENIDCFIEMYQDSVNYLIDVLNFELQKEPELLNILSYKPTR